jgi:5-methyltetrahydropteroyltriglutamate--homocysteine methyltransferase
MVHYRGGRAAIDSAVYPEMDSFWDDLAAVYAQEIHRLAELGCTYLQLDDTSFAYLNDPQQRAEFDRRGERGDVQHLTYIRTINRALAERPAGMTITTHMCRGNFRSSWVAEGGYDFVAEAVFGELAVDAFFLEYDDARSGSFAPLRFVPADKLVVLGLVTSKRPQLESKDELRRRIDEATRYIDIERLCLSPQCGFSSTKEGNSLTFDEQRAKLALVVETAAEVWGGA